MGGFGNVQDDDAFDIRRQGAEGRFLAESFCPARDVWIHAGTADFLADFVDDEDVDVGQLQARHFRFGHGL